MNKFFILLATLWLVGCDMTPECHNTYHFHRTFPAEYRKDVAEGVRKWNQVANSEHLFIIEEGDPDDNECSFRTIPYPSSEYDMMERQAGTEFAASYFWSDQSLVYVPEYWQYQEDYLADLHRAVVYLTMHEVAHVNGLSHIMDAGPEDPAVLGIQNFVPRTTYSAKDLRECRRVQACD